MLEKIRQKVLKGEYIITRHAQRRCDTRNISTEEIKHIISTGEAIENYPNDKPYREHSRFFVTVNDGVRTKQP